MSTNLRKKELEELKNKNLENIAQNEIELVKLDNLSRLNIAIFIVLAVVLVCCPIFNLSFGIALILVGFAIVSGVIENKIDKKITLLNDTNLNLKLDNEDIDKSLKRVNKKEQIIDNVDTQQEEYQVENIDIKENIIEEENTF